MDARPAAKTTPLPMILGIVGGAMLFIGSFLTWATISFDVTTLAEKLGVDPALMQGAIGDTTQSISGTKGNDGVITLIAGLVVIVAAVVLFLKADLSKVMGALMIVAGAIGAGVALYDLSTLNSAKDDALGDAAGVFQSAGIDPGVFDDVIKVAAGIGIWVCILGGIVALVAGIMALMNKASAAPAITSSMGTSAAAATSGFESSPPAAAPMSTPAAPQPVAPQPPAPDMTPSTPEAPSAPDVSMPSTPEPPSAPETGGDPGSGSTTS